MKYLKLPGEGELTGWSFTVRKGFNSIQLNLNVKGAANPVRRGLNQVMPPGTTIHFHQEIGKFYLESKSPGIDTKTLTAFLNDISDRLAVGMNDAQWQRALPELWPNTSSLTIADAIANYLELRTTGGRGYDKANDSTIEGIEHAVRNWRKFGEDLNLLVFKKGLIVEEAIEKSLENVLWRFVDWLQKKDLKPASQKAYMHYIKSAIKAAGSEQHLFIPDVLRKINIRVAPATVVTIENQEALKMLAEMNISHFGIRPPDKETILIAKIMYVFGLRIGDAVSLTRDNFEITEQGVLMKVISKKTHKSVRQLVPDPLWRDIKHALENWGGKVIFSDNNSNEGRLRKKMVKLLSTLPGMDDPIQVVRQLPDGTTKIEWSTRAKEFKPHVLRKTSGTMYHTLTGQGPSHLGNTQGAFNRHYLNSEVVDIETQRKFHEALGIKPVASE